MKAMIFAAGLGTRLKPLTDNKPKALVEIGGLAILELAIRKLKTAGVKDIIINIHHFADQIIEFVRKNKSFGLHIEFSDERDQLLETGGGLVKAAWFFDDNRPFWLYNVDVFTTMNLNEMHDYHRQKNCLATLAVMERPTKRFLLADKEMILHGWHNKDTGETISCRKKMNNLDQYAFSGIHLVEPEFLKLVTEKGKFSIVKSYLELASNQDICLFPHHDKLWFDAGKQWALKEIEKIGIEKFLN